MRGMKERNVKKQWNGFFGWVVRLGSDFKEPCEEQKDGGSEKKIPNWFWGVERKNLYGELKTRYF